MSYPLSIPITVDASWLAANHNKPEIKVFDATSHLPTLGRNAREEFFSCHIADAKWFDINEISEKSSQFPHTMPTADIFQSHMQELGLNNEDHAIIYCNSVFLSAARAWWMLRFFGHKRVSVLAGGLKSWLSIGGITASGPNKQIKKGNFTVRPAVGAQIISIDRLRRLIETGHAGQIADARSSGRFEGIDPEPRPGLRGGHMPNASNVPISKLIDENGGVRPLDEISSAFLEAGIDVERRVITTCGSGITACGLALGLALLGNENVLVYDGSWAEWGASDAPIIQNNLR